STPAACGRRGSSAEDQPRWRLRIGRSAQRGDGFPHAEVLRQVLHELDHDLKVLGADDRHDLVVMVAEQVAEQLLDGHILLASLHLLGDRHDDVAGRARDLDDLPVVQLQREWGAGRLLAVLGERERPRLGLRGRLLGGVADGRVAGAAGSRGHGRALFQVRTRTWGTSTRRAWAPRAWRRAWPSPARTPASSRARASGPSPLAGGPESGDARATRPLRTRGPPRGRGGVEPRRRRPPGRPAPRSHEGGEGSEGSEGHPSTPPPPPPPPPLPTSNPMSASSAAQPGPPQ